MARGKKKEEEERILREVFGEDYDAPHAEEEETTPADTEDAALDEEAAAVGEDTPRHTSPFAANDTIRCPRCSHVLKERHGCPYCGYHGYIPMSQKQTRRIRLILFPIVIVIAVILYFILSR